MRRILACCSVIRGAYRRYASRPLQSFLSDNRDELIARCKAMVASRPHRAATPAQLANGIPLFLDQLIRTLAADQDGRLDEGERISGPAGGDGRLLSQIGASAAAHGRSLLRLGYSVDQVVHDYGDLCQAITDLAVERDAPFLVEEFRTLNRCLDNAIADAVTAFSDTRDQNVAERQAAGENERLGVLVHEIRNSLNTAMLAFCALESGKVPVSGSTGAIMKRALNSLATLIEGAMREVKGQTESGSAGRIFSLAAFIDDAKGIAALGADARGCTLLVPEVDDHIKVAGNRDHLLAALVNLLQNALKFTHPRSEVTLHAYAAGDRISIDVKDHCGGLPAGFSEKMFTPFSQGSFDRTGLGLGLSIARRSVEQDGGQLTVQDLPGVGCVFNMSLPRHRF